ncbi:hypothetical protein FKM82_018527 [Ascaphus truei]
MTILDSHTVGLTTAVLDRDFLAPSKMMGVQKYDEPFVRRSSAGLSVRIVLFRAYKMLLSGFLVLDLCICEQNRFCKMLLIQSAAM